MLSSFQINNLNADNGYKNWSELILKKPKHFVSECSCSQRVLHSVRNLVASDSLRLTLTNKQNDTSYGYDPAQIRSLNSTLLQV